MANQSAQPMHANVLREIAASSNVRFVLDLEFVELLAKPQYLQFLAANRFFTRPGFKNYIDYLQVSKLNQCCTDFRIELNETIQNLN